jgi:hypothetical protein
MYSQFNIIESIFLRKKWNGKPQKRCSIPIPITSSKHAFQFRNFERTLILQNIHEETFIFIIQKMKFKTQENEYGC